MEVQAEPQEKNAAARGGFGGQVLTARKGDAVSIPVTETQKHCGQCLKVFRPHNIKAKFRTPRQCSYQQDNNYPTSQVILVKNITVSGEQ